MSFDLVFFGGTGDLTWRKLMPALFQAWRHGKLPDGGRIRSVARDERRHAEYRACIHSRTIQVHPSHRPTAPTTRPLARRHQPPTDLPGPALSAARHTGPHRFSRAPVRLTARR